MSASRFVMRTLAMARKEVMHIQRDPQVIVFALGIPVLLLFILGFAVSFDIEHIPLVVVDQQQTQTSRDVVREFTANDLFHVVAHVDSPRQVVPLFRRGAAKAALVIPANYSRTLKRGGQAELQLLLDGTDNNTAAVALGYANAMAFSVAKKQIFPPGFSGHMPIEARTRTFFNPALRSAVFLVPGLIAIILVIIAVMLTALTVAREYERGSMEQLFTTPVSRLEVILGKLGPYFVLGEIQVLLVVTIGISVFGVPIRGRLWLLFLVASIFLLAMLMQGLFISVLTRKQMLASQLAAISTMLPSMLLSGFIFPIDTMPVPIQVVASILPARYFVHALRAVLLRGDGFNVVAGDCAAMAAFFVFMLILATKRFKRTLG